MTRSLEQSSSAPPEARSSRACPDGSRCFVVGRTGLILSTTTVQQAGITPTSPTVTPTAIASPTPTYEQTGDGSGSTYLMQWFENGRLEIHPDAASRHQLVQVGLAGRQYLVQQGWLPQPQQCAHR